MKRDISEMRFNVNPSVHEIVTSEKRLILQSYSKYSFKPFICGYDNTLA